MILPERPTFHDLNVLLKETRVCKRTATTSPYSGRAKKSLKSQDLQPLTKEQVPGVSQIVRDHQRGARPQVDFSRAFWTPPLTPAAALRLERHGRGGFRRADEIDKLARPFPIASGYRSLRCLPRADRITQLTAIPAAAAPAQK